MSRYPFPPISRNPLTTLTALIAIPIFLPITYAIHLHHILSLRICHESSRKPIDLHRYLRLSKRITSLPPSAFTTPHIAVHDIASFIVHLPSLISKSRRYLSGSEIVKGDLITLYLRHTMTLFASHLPQAYLLRLLVTSEARRTFQKDYIKALDFDQGDLVCGVYRVAVRTPTNVEFEMVPLPGMGNVVKGGRMVVCFTILGSDSEKRRLLVAADTLMWKEVGERGLLPLERAVGKWLHELAAWWLLDRGVEFLRRLEEEEKKRLEGEN